MCKLIIESDRDAESRLNSSVVSYEGRPVFVVTATAKRCVVTPLGEDEDSYFTVKTTDLDLTPVPVGNVILGNYYVNVQRAPVRRWKQGLDRGSMSYGNMPWRVDTDIRVNSHQVKNAIINSYPTVAEALEMVLDGRRIAVPFSRNYGFGMVDDVPHLLWKDKTIGVFGKGQIDIFRKFFYLKENLLGVLNASSS